MFNIHSSTWPAASTATTSNAYPNTVTDPALVRWHRCVVRSCADADRAADEQIAMLLNDPCPHCGKARNES